MTNDVGCFSRRHGTKSTAVLIPDGAEGSILSDPNMRRRTWQTL